MRGTGGNKFYPHPMTEEQFLHAVRLGVHELRSWAMHFEGANLDLSRVTVDTKRVGDSVSVSVTADIYEGADS